MELAAKANGAGCESQRSWLQMKLGLELGTYACVDLYIRTYRLMLTYVDPMHACSDLHVTN